VNFVTCVADVLNYVMMCFRKKILRLIQKQREEAKGAFLCLISCHSTY